MLCVYTKRKLNVNKNAFQQDAYCPLFTVQGVSVRGVSLIETPSPGQRPPSLGQRPSSPGQRAPPLDRDPLPLDRPPPPWTEWQTQVKTLPYPKLRLRAEISLEPYLHTWLSLRYLCAARGSVPRQSASRRASPPPWAPHSVPCWRQRRRASGRRDVRVRRTCKHPLQSVLPSRVTPDINKTKRRR